MMFRLSMEGSTPQPRPTRLGRLAGAAVALFLCLIALAPAAGAQGRPDQIFRKNERTGKVMTHAGTISECSLSTVAFTQRGKQSSYPSAEVLRIVWGDVPASYRDGMTYLGRGDFESAVTQFKLAASDADTREVVQAAARLKAAEALLGWGASDPSRFEEAVGEADRFLSDYPSGRDVPHARWVKARAHRLAGDAAAAAAGFEALYREGANNPPATGYDRETCLNAGLEAAEAYLAADDTLKARELFGALQGQFASLASTLTDAPAEVLARLAGAQGVASVGEGFCLLAGNQSAQARTFFEGKARRADAPAAEQYAARLGLAEALLAEGKLRDAQVEFAAVAALDYTSRERQARALVGLADTTQKLQDSDATTQARRWLKLVTGSFGDTPAARKAAEMLQAL
jgi:outer membrane protein assembly factor BamD (BamD/ComL family)